MIRRIAAALPPGVVRAVARLRYRLPVVGPAIGWLSRTLVAGEGTIRHGHGAGLRIDAGGVAAGYLLGTADPLEQAALADHLKPGGVFYDVGANVGFFCLLAARVVGPAGRVVAFEPHPRYAALVRKNAALNGFAVEVIEAAVADAAGRVTLRLDGVSCPSTEFGRAAGGLSVPTVTLDEVIRDRGFRPPDYVVVDVEGAELRVLAGMRETLRLHRPVVLVEVHWLGPAFTDYVAEHLAPLGYAVRNLDGGPIPAGPVRYHALLTPTGGPADA